MIPTRVALAAAAAWLLAALSGCGADTAPGAAPADGAADGASDGPCVNCALVNPCVKTVCTAGACSDVAVDDGTSCDDGNACNGMETCVGGSCRPGRALGCDDGNPCTLDLCDPALGCTPKPSIDGLACPAASPCLAAGQCQAGVCAAGPTLSCDDGNPCTVDSCDALAGCRNVPAADGLSCGDDDVCNGAEICQAGVCGKGTALRCDDGNPCTTDSCDHVQGCRNVARADGAPCDDGTVCNGREVCQGGACQAGTPPDCADGNPCTDDSCDGTAGCKHVSRDDGAACATGGACGGAGTCEAGVCSAGAAPSCDDGNPCTTDSCAAGGGCAHVMVADGTSCAAVSQCGGGGTCQRGACVESSPRNCNDNNPCTRDTCDPQTGCHNDAQTGTSCSDGNPCNGDETCQAGACKPGVALVCDDHNPCTADSCDAGAGCKTTPIGNGTSCGGDKTCMDGVCKAPGAMCSVATAAHDCDDNDKCTVDSCADGQCMSTPRTCPPTAGCTAGCESGTGSCLQRACGAGCLTPSAGTVTGARLAGGGLAVDSSGNQYIVGAFQRSITLGGTTLMSAGGFDLYVASYTGDNVLRWARSFGNATADQIGTAVAVDASGLVVVAGTFAGDLDFRIPNPFFDPADDSDGSLCGGEFVEPLSATGSDNAFLAALDPASGAAIWAQAINLGGGGVIAGLAADPRSGPSTGGTTVVGSMFGATSGSASTPNAFGCLGALTSHAGSDLAVARIDPKGTSHQDAPDPACAKQTADLPAPVCQWAKRFGAAGDQAGKAVAADLAGGVDVVGNYGVAFNFGAATTTLAAVFAGGQNIFVAKLNADTGAPIWARGFGDATAVQNQDGRGIAADASGNVAVVGAMLGKVDFGGGILSSSDGGQDILAAKLAVADGAALWAKIFGDSAQAQEANAVVIDGASGNVIVGGELQGSADFGGGNIASAGDFDAFLTVLTGGDGSHVCSKTAGDKNPQELSDMVLVPGGGGIRIKGRVYGTMDFGGHPLDATALGDFGVYLQRLVP